MKRSCIANGALIAVGFVGGCQSAYWVGADRCAESPPIGYAERLSAVEHTRLAARPAADGDAATWASDSSNATSAGLGPRGSGLPWTLAEMSGADGDDLRTTESETATVTGGWGTEDQEGYRRRPLGSFWETVKRDVEEMPGDLWRDTKRVYANPVNLVILGSAYGGSLALQQTGPDDTVEHRYSGGHHTFDHDWRDAFGAVGNPGVHFALAGAWYALGQQTQHDKTYEVGKTMFSALIINGLTTMAGQAATWDRQPNGEWGTLPSGHTSSSFCMASVLHEAYGHAVGIPLYGLATLVAMERIDDDEHYFSDVVMGAVVGTVIGHAVASGRDPEFFGWKLLPYANPNGASGVAFMKTVR